MAKDKKGPEPYNLDAAFERSLVHYVCTSPRAYGLVGDALEPEALSCETARLAVAAAQQIAKETGKGPEDTCIAVQRLRRTMSEGRLTMEQVEAVLDYLLQAMSGQLPPEDSVVAEVAPILSRRAEEKAVKQVVDNYMQKGDYAKAMAGLEKAKRIGKVSLSIGSITGTGAFDVIDRVRTMQRLSTGVFELDEVLDGGLGRGEIGMWLGNAKDGKSMALSHVMAASMAKGLFCCYATLELSEAMVQSRLLAHLTDVPINQIMDGRREVAQRRLDALKGRLGPGIVKDFPAQATGVGEIAEWVKMCEDQIGREVDLLVVDYADKLGVPGTKDIGQYQSMLLVYEGLRHMAFNKKNWLWTASQASRQGKSGVKFLDLQHVSDSLHKVRVVDLIVSLNAREDGNMMEFYVAGNRSGKSRMAVGPLPTDFAVGRVAPIVPYTP